jgi:hypothetical protein
MLGKLQNKAACGYCFEGLEEVWDWAREEKQNQGNLIM